MRLSSSIVPVLRTEHALVIHHPSVKDWACVYYLVLRKTEHALKILVVRRTDHALVMPVVRRTEHALMIPVVRRIEHVLVTSVLRRCGQVSQSDLTDKVPGLSQQINKRGSQCLKDSTQGCALISHLCVCTHRWERTHTRFKHKNECNFKKLRYWTNTLSDYITSRAPTIQFTMPPCTWYGDFYYCQPWYGMPLATRFHQIMIPASQCLMNVECYNKTQ